MKNIILAILAIAALSVAIYLNEDVQVERDVSGEYDHPPSFSLLPHSAPYNP